MRLRKTYMYIHFQQNWVCRSVKPCTQIYLHNIASCIDLQLPIAILLGSFFRKKKKKKILKSKLIM